MAFAHPSTLIGKLRTKRPDHIIVSGDEIETPIRINLGAHRDRAKRCMDTLKDLQWTKIEMYDSKGGLCAVHNRGSDDESPPGEVETLQTAGRTAEVQGMVRIMLHAQEMALDRTTRMITPLLDTLNKTIETQSRRLDNATKDADRVRSEYMEAQQQWLVQLAKSMSQRKTADGEANAEDGPMDKLMPDLLRAMLTPKDAPAAEEPKNANPPKNGHAKPNGHKRAS